MLQGIVNNTDEDGLKLPGDSWTPVEAADSFALEEFVAPFVVVTKKETGQRGTLLFKDDPRIYFGWEALEVSQ